MATEQVKPSFLTREELYKLVWETPAARLAARFGITGTSLSNVCKRNNIPTPGRGYWAKREHGKAGPRPRLPKAREVDPVKIDFAKIRSRAKTQTHGRVANGDIEVVALRCQGASKTVVVTREELFDRIWMESVGRAATYFWTDIKSLKSLCEQLAIHIPPPQRWMGMKHCKAPPMPQLPPRSHAQGQTAEFKVFSDWPFMIVEDEWAPMLEKHRDREFEPKRHIVVSEHLRKTPPLIARTWSDLRERQPNSSGLVRAESSSSLDVEVSPANVNRAMRIMNALYKAFKERRIELQTEDELNHAVALDSYNEQRSRLRGTCVTVFGEQIRISLRELTHLDESIANNRFDKVVPSGRLYLSFRSLTSHEEWGRYYEITPRRLEQMLNDFLVTLYFTAVSLKRSEKESEAWRLKRAKKEKERWQANEQFRRERDRREQERLKLMQLLQDSEAWKKSQVIREFAAAFKEAELGAHGMLRSDQAQYLDWMLSHADRLDPMRSSPQSILDDEEPVRRIL